MKQSEKILAGSFGGVLLVGFGFPMISSALFGPVFDAQERRDLVEGQLTDAGNKFDVATSRLRTLRIYKDRALSANYSEGSHAYMQWLTDLAEDVVKLRNPKVIPERIRPSRDSVYVAVPIRVTGEGTVEQLREFLFRFHRANVLHQVTAMKAEALDRSSRPRLDISITCEALSITDGDVKGTNLFPRTKLVSVESDPDRRITVRTDSDAVWPDEGPFEVRIGGSYLNVIKRAKCLWTTDSQAAATKAGTEVTYRPKPPKPAPGQEPVIPKPLTTTLTSDWDGKSSTIEVESDPGLPAGPVSVTIGNATIEIKERSEVWAIDDQQFTAKADSVVELSPIHPEFSDAKIEDFEDLIKLNPFAKPVPYRPRFDLIGDKNVARGTKAELTPRISGFGGDADAASYEVLSELPAGMSYADGKLSWEPPADLAAGKFEVKMRATAPGLVDPMEQTFQLTLVDRNEAPEIKPPTDLVAVIGQELKFTVSATDKESDASALQFSLGEGAPAGAAIDAKTGEVTWTPSEETVPGDTAIPVQVADNGTPKQTTTTPVTVKVEDDKARFTYLTGFIATNKDRQAWLHDRSSNKRVILREGGSMKYAGYEGLILSIGTDFVLLQNKGETLRIEMGRPLRDAIVIAQAEKPDYDEDPNSAGGEPKPEDGESNDRTGATSEADAKTDAAARPTAGEEKSAPVSTTPVETPGEEESPASAPKPATDAEPQQPARTEPQPTGPEAASSSKEESAKPVTEKAPAGKQPTEKAQAEQKPTPVAEEEPESNDE